MAQTFKRGAATSPLATTLVHHAEFDHSLDAILESLSDPAGAPMILALGVPGFGKTELARVVDGEVASGRLDEMLADPNHVPVVRIEAFAPDAGRSFGWREGFLSILDQLGEAGVDLRAGDSLDRSPLLERRGASQRTRGTNQLQLDVIEGLRFHTTVVLLIDEIEHIAYQHDVARFGASADILKTIANETGVRIIATGSYEGLGFKTLSGQLLRRTRPLHLHRYHAEIKEEYAEYTRVVAAMLAMIGYEDDPADLVPVLYRQSLGAIGTTADLLMRAEHAWHAHGDSLVFGITRNSRSDGDLAKVAAGIVEAEKSMEDSPDARTKLDALIGLAQASEILIPTKKARTSVKRTSHPGRRKPSRDLVGRGRVA